MFLSKQFNRLLKVFSTKIKLLLTTIIFLGANGPAYSCDFGQILAETLNEYQGMYYDGSDYLGDGLASPMILSFGLLMKRMIDIGYACNTITF